MGRQAKSLVRPGLFAVGREIVRVGLLIALGLVRLDQLVRDALALGIGHRLFLALELELDLAAHVGGGSPAHERIRLAGHFRGEFQHPVLHLAAAGLHGIACRTIDFRKHASLPFNPARHVRCEQAGNGRSGRIRTCDPLVPNQMRYQTALHSE